MRCCSCKTEVKEDDALYGDSNTLREGEPFCDICFYDDEPEALVFYKDDETPYTISGTRNETWGDFTVKWHSTDPWRGYFEAKSDTYSLVNTAELLAYHESEEMLAKFDKRIRELFDEHDIDYARVFSRSSNVFYQNYDLYVTKEHKLPAKLLVAKAKEEVNYDNPRWYRNIIFDEDTLGKLSKLFPEDRVESDVDALKIVGKYGDSMISELQKRIGQKGDQC